MEERGGLKEELMGLKVEKTNLEQRVEKLTAENEDLVTELQGKYEVRLEVPNDLHV